MLRHSDDNRVRCMATATMSPPAPLRSLSRVEPFNEDSPPTQRPLPIKTIVCGAPIGSNLAQSHFSSLPSSSLWSALCAADHRTVAGTNPEPIALALVLCAHQAYGRSSRNYFTVHTCVCVSHQISNYPNWKRNKSEHETIISKHGHGTLSATNTNEMRRIQYADGHTRTDG